jgi:hypothetical protein
MSDASTTDHPSQNLPVLRIARPTDHLEKVGAMYAQGLGFAVLGEFLDHDGFDGVILGHPNAPYHLEFTSKPDQHFGRAPTEENLLVFYIPNRKEWESCCERMVGAGFAVVPSFNPYWDEEGQTFEDIDGYRVVLLNGEWTS